MITEQQWQNAYVDLENEIESHRIGFIVSKKCLCKGSDCKHYEHEKKRLFQKRINLCLAQGIMINARADGFV